MTACQPLTARTEQICTTFCISQFLNFLGNIFTEGQKIKEIVVGGGGKFGNKGCEELVVKGRKRV